jgi:hypothetical protein
MTDRVLDIGSPPVGPFEAQVSKMVAWVPGAGVIPSRR